MSKTEETEDKQAFKDFQKSLSVKEFETIFRICKERYVKLSDILESRQKFVDKILEQVEMTKEQVEDIPDEKKKDALKGISKLMRALGRKGDRKMFNELRSDVMEAKYLTEFLNRFSPDSDSFEELDFSFLKEIADEV
jgi:23S rRNA A2030 N6-methylase RlmJ